MIQYVFYYPHNAKAGTLESFKEKGAKQIVFSCTELSRFGKESLSEIIPLAAKAQKLGFRVSLEWDILMREGVLHSSLFILNDLYDKDIFDSIRVLDQGGVWAIRENFPKWGIELICENAHHNLKSLKAHLEAIGPQLEKFVLSLELTKEQIKLYRKEIQVPFEVLGYGRILLFYTPRSLVQASLDHYGHDENVVTASFKEFEADSLESAHKKLPVVENLHGTFMFNNKSLFLGDVCDELNELGAIDICIDSRWEDTRENWPMAYDCFIGKGSASEFKKSHSPRLIRGPFSSNKTKVLFPKLKNWRLQDRGESFVGEISSTIKGRGLIFHYTKKGTIKKGETLRINTPDGKTKFCELKGIEDFSGTSVNQMNGPGVYIIPLVSGISTRSGVHLEL